MNFKAIFAAFAFLMLVLAGCTGTATPPASETAQLSAEELKELNEELLQASMDGNA